MTELNQLEDRARTLLQAAAETVDVSPGVEAVVRRRPVWPVIVAAAVVVALAVGLPMLLRGERDAEPAPPPDGAVVTVPQTLFMTTEQATRTLETAGLAVEVEGQGMNECDLPEDRVVDSRPAAGTPVATGTTVRVVLPGDAGAAAFCVGAERLDAALGLLDLARFGTTDLTFAPTVRIWIDGRMTQTLTAGQARDPEAWGERSPLTRLVTRLDATDWVWTRIDRGRQEGCGPDDPPMELRDREPILIDPTGPVDGIFGCSWVRVYESGGRRVTDVVSTEWTPGDPARGRVPLESLVLDDGRRIELVALSGAEWSCLEIQGIDAGIRSCVPPPSERVPAVTAAIGAWSIAQRSDTSPFEVYGTTSDEVTEVVVRFDSRDGPTQIEAHLLRVTDVATLALAGISEPFGLYFAELPPGTTAEDVRAVAFNADGEQLGTADFSHLQGQPLDAMIGGRPQS